MVKYVNVFARQEGARGFKKLVRRRRFSVLTYK